MDELGLRRKTGGRGAVLGLVLVSSKRQERIELIAVFLAFWHRLGGPFPATKRLDLASLTLAAR